MIPSRSFERCFSAMDVIGRINVTRDNGAGGPLLRIFFKKRKFKLLAISYLYKIRVDLFEVSKCRRIL